MKVLKTQLSSFSVTAWTKCSALIGVIVGFYLSDYLKEYIWIFASVLLVLVVKLVAEGFSE
jgi:putative Mn2+ efflux pump MntP